MKIFKSHFWYNKNQRNGIFVLGMIILILQVLIFTNVFSRDKIIEPNRSEILAFQHQIDSLRLIQIENRKLKIYPFNPNYINDYKGEQLGMSLEEIDRLLIFRKSNKFINSKKEFQNITKVSDSLLNKIAPYFKFPDWVTKHNQQKNTSRNFNYNKTDKPRFPKHKISTTNINKATAEDFKTINGIGSAFSERIIKYRSKLQGFSFHNQLYEIWGLEKEVADRVLSVFNIKTKPLIKKENVNTLEFKQLLKNPYVDYKLCKMIFEYRDEVAELQDITELKNIKDFPLELYDRIVLYLLAE
jgi:DNA uptake protein ComE-like DNA-binding protein